MALRKQHIRYSNCVLILSLFIFCLCSCSREYHTATNCNNLQLSEKGDLNASGSVGINNSSVNNYDVQIGYSPIKHLGFAVHYIDKGTGYDNITGGRIINRNQVFNPTSSATPRFRTTEIRSLDVSVNSYLFIGNGGIGNFKDQMYLGKDNKRPYKKQGVLLDLYLGQGFGQINNVDYFDNDLMLFDGSLSLKFSKTYLQGGLYWTSKSYSEKNRLTMGVGLIMKAELLNFYSGEVLGSIDNVTLSHLERLRENNPLNIVESNLHFNLGINDIRFFINMNTIPLSQQIGRFSPKPRKNTYTVGLIFECGNLLKNIKQKN